MEELFPTHYTRLVARRPFHVNYIEYQLNFNGIEQPNCTIIPIRLLPVENYIYNGNDYYFTHLFDGDKIFKLKRVRISLSNTNDFIVIAGTASLFNIHGHYIAEAITPDKTLQ